VREAHAPRAETFALSCPSSASSAATSSSCALAFAAAAADEDRGWSGHAGAADAWNQSQEPVMTYGSGLFRACTTHGRLARRLGEKTGGAFALVPFPASLNAGSRRLGLRKRDQIICKRPTREFASTQTTFLVLAGNRP
jgi:hypothetical protein